VSFHEHGLGTVITLKKTYSRPHCISKSYSEVSRLLRERRSEQPQSWTLGLHTDESLAPILVLVGYLGDTVSIQSAAEGVKIHGHLCAATDDSRLVHTPCRESECNNAIPADFLLLDLRRQDLNRVNVLRKACSGDVPLVILTIANSDAEFSEFCDEYGAWLMIGSASAEVVQTLSGILNLRGHVLEQPSSY